jgi:hypothetical protein
MSCESSFRASSKDHDEQMTSDMGCNRTTSLIRYWDNGDLGDDVDFPNY